VTGTGTQPPGSRRRGAALEATILAAAWAELGEVGYARLTMEAVAARARTGKQVLYRRWPNRAQLAVAALRHAVGSVADTIPDTGTLRGDIVGLLRIMAHRARNIGPDLIHGLLAEIPDLDPDFFMIMSGIMDRILDRARARGEIGAGHLHPRVVTLAVDLLRYEGVKTSPVFVADATEADVDSLIVEIVDEVYLPLVRTLAGAPNDAPRTTHPGPRTPDDAPRTTHPGP
jgi:AcrR family transcriptional regulator